MTVSAAPSLITREGGPGTSFAVVLDTQPTADVSIPVSSSNAGEGAVSSGSLLFTPTNWNMPQTVSVTGVADGVRDDDVNYSIVLGPATSNDWEYSGIDPADVAAVNLDNTYTGFVYSIHNSLDDTTDDLIERVSLQGENRETVVDMEAVFGNNWTFYEPHYLDFDYGAGKIYWADGRPAAFDGPT